MGHWRPERLWWALVSLARPGPKKTQQNADQSPRSKCTLGLQDSGWHLPYCCGRSAKNRGWSDQGCVYGLSSKTLALKMASELPLGFGEDEFWSTHFDLRQYLPTFYGRVMVATVDHDLTWQSNNIPQGLKANYLHLCDKVLETVEEEWKRELLQPCSPENWRSHVTWKEIIQLLLTGLQKHDALFWDYKGDNIGWLACWWQDGRRGCGCYSVHIKLLLQPKASDIRAFIHAYSMKLLNWHPTVLEWFSTSKHGYEWSENIYIPRPESLK